MKKSGFISEHMRGYRLKLVLVILATLISSFLGLFQTYMFSYVVDNVIDGKPMRFRWLERKSASSWPGRISISARRESHSYSASFTAPLKYRMLWSPPLRVTIKAFFSRSRSSRSSPTSSLSRIPVPSISMMIARSRARVCSR